MKPIFSTLIAYHLETTLPSNFAELVEKQAFDSLSSTETFGRGFGMLSGIDSRLIESDGRFLVRFAAQQKRINQVTLEAMMTEKLEKLASQNLLLNPPAGDGDLAQSVKNELLRYSPISYQSIYMLICPFENRLYVSAATENAAEDALGVLRAALGSLKVRPLSFMKNLDEQFGDYFRYYQDEEYRAALPKVLSVDIYGRMASSGNDGMRASLVNICLRDETVFTLLKDLNVRSLCLSLKHEDNEDETLATFQLNNSPKGGICLKKFDYGTAAMFELDTQMANEEGEGDMAHQLAVEMLTVGRYTPRIYDALAAFAGGYYGKKESTDEESAEPAVVSAGANE